MRLRANSDLALGLEQAGAHIATDHIGFARYLTLWNEKREDALAWSDPILTRSERTLATTLATSVARLSPESHRLLDQLAMWRRARSRIRCLRSPAGEAADFDAHNARASLIAFALAILSNGKDAERFVVHRLVQDFAGAR